jgi:hypothetical protein
VANGLPRTAKYKELNVEDHLRFIDNDLDDNDYRIELLAKATNRKLNYVLVTMVSLLLVICGTLVAAVVRA